MSVRVMVPKSALQQYSDLGFLLTQLSEDVQENTQTFDFSLRSNHYERAQDVLEGLEVSHGIWVSPDHCEVAH